MIPAEPVVIAPVVEPVVEPEPIVVESEVVAAPGLLNEGERKRIDQVMAGLSRFGPVSDPIRPAPRMEVDSLSSVSAADWSGMDGMGEEIAGLPRFEPAPAPVPAPTTTVMRREPAAAPVLEAVSTPTADPIKGWVTADRLFSDFGD